MKADVPRVHWRGVLGTRAVIEVWSDVDHGAALVVVVTHHQPSQTIPWARGAAQPHLLRILVQLHRGEHRAQVQLWDVVEDCQRQHEERQPGDQVY